MDGHPGGLPIAGGARRSYRVALPARAQQVEIVGFSQGVVRQRRRLTRPRIVSRKSEHGRTIDRQRRWLLRRDACRRRRRGSDASDAERATKGTLRLGGQEWTITGDPSTKKLRGTRPGSVVDLKIVNRRLLIGEPPTF